MSAAAIQATWIEASAAYAAAALASDLTPDSNELVDAQCKVMDHLINEVPAPSLAAVAYKLRLAEWRCADYEAGLFKDHEVGISNDILRLAGLDLPGGAIDPHERWLELRHEARDLGQTNDEATIDRACDLMRLVEAQSSATPALTLRGLIAKLVTLVEVGLEGFVPDEDGCQSAIRDAQRLTGCGSTQGAFTPAMRNQAGGAAA